MLRSQISDTAPLAGTTTLPASSGLVLNTALICNGLGRPDILVGAVREANDDGEADRGSAFLLLMDGL